MSAPARPDFLALGESIAPWLREVRHALHRRPEPGNHEFETAGAIEAALAGLSIPCRRLLDTALVATLAGPADGPAVALRADMDALPVSEETGCPFASERAGYMHACGHDFHMAAALGAAAILSRLRERLPGSVLFLFQPDEEGDGGAQRMIAAGCLDTPPVGAVFGCHVSPDLPAGTVGVRYGKFYAASNPFRVEFLGRAAHGAEPEKAADALSAAAETVCALRALAGELSQRHGRAVISVGTFQSGTAGNIIPGQAAISGIIRTLGPQARQEAVQALRQTAEATAALYGVQAHVHIRESYPGVVNDDSMTALAEQTVRALLGPDHTAVIDAPVMTTEDFGYFLQARPGTFYHVGVGGDAPLHSPRFLPPDSLLPLASATHAAILWEYLKSLP